MKNFIVSCAFILFLFQMTFAQKEAKSVENVIRTMFDAMREGDSAKLRNCFHPEMRMVSVQVKETGEPVVKTEGPEAVNGFVKAVGTPHNKIWDERIYNLKINLDGGLAQAWCDYEFYIEKDYSHCGVDAFQLVKVKGEWKIVSLADTRRKTCQIKK